MTDETSTEHVKENGIWMRGLFVLVLVVLFSIAETVLIAVAVIQFFWMLFSKEKNAHIAEFGVNLAAWLSNTAKFQAGVTEEKPFPWAKWKSDTAS